MKRGVFLRELKRKMDNPRNKYERLRAKVEIIIANMDVLITQAVLNGEDELDITIERCDGCVRINDIEIVGGITTEEFSHVTNMVEGHFIGQWLYPHPCYTDENKVCWRVDLFNE